MTRIKANLIRMFILSDQLCNLNEIAPGSTY